MILPKKISERFYKALSKKEKEYGRGFNKFLCFETGFSSGYISQILNGKQKASQKAQIKISEACGLNYKDFLEDEWDEEEYQRELKQENEYYEKHPEKLEQLKWEWKHDAPPDLDLDFLAEKVADKLKLHTSISDLANKKIEKHQKLVGGFEHQELAIEINQALLELEKTAGKDGLLEIKGVLRQMLREAEKKRAAANGTEGK